MGANLCCMGGFEANEKPKEATSEINNSGYKKLGSLTEEMKKNKKKKKKKVAIQPGNKVASVESLTLGDCLLSSPTLNPSINIAHKQSLKVFKQQQLKKAAAASPAEALSTECFHTPRISFSEQKLGGNIEKEEEEEATSSSKSACGGGSQSGKLRKRVSFKMPEESDVIIFHSPRERF